MSKYLNGKKLPRGITVDENHTPHRLRVQVFVKNKRICLKYFPLNQLDEAIEALRIAKEEQTKQRNQSKKPTPKTISDELEQLTKS